MKRARKMNALFIQWDIDCSGFLPAQELETVLTHWNGLDSEKGKETGNYFIIIHMRFTGEQSF